MPLTIRLTDLSTPQAWILQDATINADGVMTKLMVQQLQQLVNNPPSPPANPTLIFSTSTRPSAASTGATPTAPVFGYDTDNHVFNSTDGTNWYDQNGNVIS